MARILFVINDLGIGGAQRVFVNDASWLAQQGHKVCLVTLYDNQEKVEMMPIPRDIEVVSLGVKDGYLAKLKGVASLRRVIKSFKPTHLVSTLDESNSISRIAVCGKRPLKHIVREANEAEGKSIKIKCFEIIFSLFRSPVIIAVSNAVKESIVSYMPWIKDSVFVVNNGIDCDLSNENKEEARWTGAQILTVGSLTKKKNQIMLLRAFALVLRELEQSQISLSTRLVLVGGGPEETRLRQGVEDLGLADKVVFAGKVEPGSIDFWYRSSQIFALSSEREGSPNVILEAMKYSLPVVTTLVGSAGEMVENGVNGFVSHKDDLNTFTQGLLSLVKDTSLRERMGALSRDKVEKEYSIGIHRKKLLEVLSL